MNIGDFNSDDLDFDDLDCGDWIVVIWIVVTWIEDFAAFFGTRILRISRVNADFFRWISNSFFA